MVPTYDFGNVARPVRVTDETLRIPAVTGLLYTPVFVNPTILGAMPGYYNSAWGVMVTAAPNDQLYTSAGIYDGNGANGLQTGLQAGPTINAYRFGIAELGAAWLFGSDDLPGSFGAGGWSQTGTLSLSTPSSRLTQNGTHGFYAFGSQSLWRGQTTGNTRSVSAFLQVGANNSRTMLATSYVGFGLTAFGIVPTRKLDSVGIGVAWSSSEPESGCPAKRNSDPRLCAGPCLWYGFSAADADGVAAAGCAGRTRTRRCVYPSVGDFILIRVGIKVDFRHRRGRRTRSIHSL